MEHMTVRSLRETLSYLPDDMPVIIEVRCRPHPITEICRTRLMKEREFKLYAIEHNPDDLEVVCIR